MLVFDGLRVQSTLAGGNLKRCVESHPRQKRKATLVALLTPGPWLSQQQFLGLPFWQAGWEGQSLQTLPHPRVPPWLPPLLAGVEVPVGVGVVEVTVGVVVPGGVVVPPGALRVPPALLEPRMLDSMSCAVCGRERRSLALMAAMLQVGQGGSGSG